MEKLLDQYEFVIKRLERTNFQISDDKYSGAFLPIAFDEYWEAKVKVLHVGRETAGWNTDNNKNTLNRIFEANESGSTRSIVDEAVDRYKKHLEINLDGKIKTKTNSRFKQYFFKIAKDLSISPKSLIYANLFAWDYDKKSPLARPKKEIDAVASVSKELLAIQIRHFKPDFIIFSTGFDGIDPIIKELFATHFDGWKNTVPVMPRKIWEFKAGGATCFRIAHPRATWGHSEYREMVIQRIKLRV